MSLRFDSNSIAAPRIAIVVLRNDPLDGRLKRQVTSLTTADHDVKVFSVFEGDQKDGWFSALIRPLVYRLQRRSVISRLKRFDPHLVISHEPEALSVAGHYLTKNSRPHIYDAHEYYEGQRGVTEPRRAWLANTYQRYGKTVDALITVSPGMIKLYGKTHKTLPAGILIANAADASKTPPYDGRLHREIGVSQDTKILLYQGGIWEARGVEDVIQASTLLPENWITVFMGYGPLKANLPLHDRLHVLDSKPQNELLSWTSGATLGVIPYPDNSLNHTYCLPNKLWEFPLVGVPIVARKLPDLAEFLHEHGVGLTYPNDGSGKELAEVITGISPKNYETLQRNCRLFAKVENWQKYERSYLNLVDRLLNS